MHTLYKLRKGGSLTVITINNVMVFILLSILVSGRAQAGKIERTAHDFRLKGYNGSEYCVICHTPHNSDKSVTTTPLWNPDVTSPTFAMYSTKTRSSTNDESTSGEGQPAGISKLCVSCHDGVTAIDIFGDYSGSIYILSNPNLGFDLQNHHPVAVTYDAALAKLKGLHDPTTKTVTIGAGSDKAKTGTIKDLLLINKQVQCSSCHDVHTGTVSSDKDSKPFLRITKARGQLCLGCHDK